MIKSSRLRRSMFKLGGAVGLGKGGVANQFWYSGSLHPGKVKTKFRVALAKGTALARIENAVGVNEYERFLARQVVEVLLRKKSPPRSINDFVLWLYNGNLVKPPIGGIRTSARFNPGQKGVIKINRVGRQSLHAVLRFLSNDTIGILESTGRGTFARAKKNRVVGATVRKAAGLRRNAPFIWKIAPNWEEEVRKLTRIVVAVSPSKNADASNQIAGLANNAPARNIGQKTLLRMDRGKAAKSDYEIALKLVETAIDLTKKKKPASIVDITLEMTRLSVEERREYRLYGNSAKVSNLFALVPPQSIERVGRILEDNEIIKRIGLK